jgi:hypothetical protein
MQLLHEHEPEARPFLIVEFLTPGSRLSNPLLRPSEAIPAPLDMLPELLSRGILGCFLQLLEASDLILEMLLLALEIAYLILEIHDLVIDSRDPFLGAIQLCQRRDGNSLH